MVINILIVGSISDFGIKHCGDYKNLTVDLAEIIT